MKKRIVVPRTRMDLPPPMPIPVGDLDLDLDNPRLASLIDAPKTQDQAVVALWKNFEVAEVALSIVANGYWQHEPLLVEARGSKFVVVEGNRRLAAVRLLRNPRLRELAGAKDLPAADAKLLSPSLTLPAVVCERERVWQFLGFRHINGPQEWDSESKATYIAWVRDKLGHSIEEIAATIGDENENVARLYRAQSVLEQAEDKKLFDRRDCYKRSFYFSHLATALLYSSVRKFIGIKDSAIDTRHPVREARFEDLTYLLRWLYGSRKEDVEPLVARQNPHLRFLDRALQKTEGISALKAGRGLMVARDLARGDLVVFEEELQSAKLALQKAHGLLPSLPTTRAADRKVTAESVYKLAERIWNDLK